MEEIMVSVFCNTYNHERYIRDALEGFVKQKTNFAFEVLIHDDASTDKTADIIREYEQRYPSIIKPIYQTENQYSKKIPISLEFQIPRMKGKYVALCEGDDYWTDDCKLQKQFDYMQAHPECSLVAHMAMTHVIGEKEMKPYTDYDFEQPGSCELSAEQIIENHLLFPLASMFYRKDYYDNNISFVKTITVFDYALKILLATEGTAHVIPEVMSVYRKGVEGSWTKRVQCNKEAFRKHLEDAVGVLEKINEYRNYQYDEAIKRNILQREFDMLMTITDISKLHEKPYLALYRKLPYKTKVALYIRKYIPRLYDVVRGVRW